MNHVPPWQRNVELVFQNYALWPRGRFREWPLACVSEKWRAAKSNEVVEALKQVDLQGTEIVDPHNFPADNNSASP
jgi:ABC-type Fe3+/spermidine/putrescine transport system ATPase subunit